MAETYLSKDEATKILIEYFQCSHISESFIKSVVEQIPPANVVEVVHAYWKENDNGTWSCSRCNSWIPNEQHYYARFCLHCGAKMEGEENST